MSDSNISSFINARYFDDSSSAANSGRQDRGNTTNDSIRKTVKTPRTRRTALQSKGINTFGGNNVSIQGSFRNTKSKPKSTGKQRNTANASMTKNTINTAATRMCNSNDKVLFVIFELSKDIGTRVGICIIIYNTGEMILSDFMDSQIYIRTVHKIQIYQPTDILLPNSSLSPTVSKLATIIKFNVSENVKICEASSRLFNNQDGLSTLAKYSINDFNQKFKAEEIVEKTFALSAVSASIKYTEDMYSKSPNQFYHKFDKFRIKYEGTENTMLIDTRTISGLELVENKFEKCGLSFLKFLDTTCTKMGKRALRNNILQPLTDISNIELRLASVIELQSEIDLLDSLRVEMKSLQDLDNLFSKLLSVNHIAIKPEHKINYIISLKDSIAKSKIIDRLLGEVQLESRLLKEIKEIFHNPTLLQIEIDINKYINEDCTWANSSLELENQRSYAVKSGSNGLLDISRQIYKTTITEIINEVDNLSNQYELPLDYSYQASRGFFIKIKKKDIHISDSIPEVFLNITQKRNHVECNTLNLMKANSRLKEVVSEILIISEKVIEELFTDIIKNISVLFMISEAISMLDLLCCFAFNANKRDYCIPKFSNKLFLESSRHPIFETTIKDYVPNDITSSTTTSSLQIITGCNMSGKSLYLRQVALLCILAQMGSPVPAKSAVFPIYTKLHARVCNDTMELTSSTFSFEMKEMAYFLDDVTSSTLIIIDELGRGSSIGDGFSISLAITEHLLETKAIVFLSTHFQDIANILKRKPRVTHLTMKTDILPNEHMKMLYKASSNSCIIENSGLKFVTNIFHPDIVKEAYSISRLLKADRSNSISNEMSEEERKENNNTTNQMKRIHNLVDILAELTKNIEDLSLDTLKDIQNQFIDSFEY